MIRWKMHSTALDFEGDVEWTVESRMRTPESPYPNSWIICKDHPEGGGWYSDFEKDAWELSVEELKKKWSVKEIYRLGKSLCRAGYLDRLHPEKSWSGHNPLLLEKIRQFMLELEEEERELEKKDGS